MSTFSMTLAWLWPAPRVDILIRRAANGERQAVEELVERYQDRVYSLALNFCRDSHQAQDLAQEAWIRILRGLPSFRGDCKFTTWLYRVAANTFINQNKTRRPEPVLEAEPRVEARLPDLDLRAAVAALPEDFRAVVALRFAADLSYQEIADVLEIPLGTVQSRLKRALDRLSRTLGASR